MDLDDVGTIEFNALGGADTITVNDLSGTDVSAVNLNLAGTLGGATGDGQVDAVVVKGTAADDRLRVEQSGSDVSVVGLPARVNITNLEATDTLTLNP